MFLTERNNLFKNGVSLQMNTYKTSFRPSLYIITLLALGISTQAMAGAYALFREYNAVEIGNSGSGGAAIATDASTAYANPAGLVRIPNTQLVISADPVFVQNEFKGSNTRTSIGLPPYTQTGTAISSLRTIVPGLYLAVPLNFGGLPQNSLSFGFSVDVPYGLSTNYTNNSIIRYSSTSARLYALDISPSLAFKINDQYSIGLGIDFEHIDLDFRAMFGAPPLSLALDSSGKNVADGWGTGFHAGVLGQITPEFRAGLTFHSRINSTLRGYSSLSGRLVTFPPGAIPATISSDSFNTKFTLPPSAVLSGLYDINNRWTVNGTVYYTWWSALPNNQIANNLAGLPAITLITATIPQYYNNAWTLALGGSYKVTSMVLLRAGMAYDQSPIKSTYRNVTLPDSNKFSLSIGANVAANKQFNFDVGYMHIFASDASVSIPLTVGAQTSQAVGSYNHSYSDIFGFQMNYNMV
jgi:long-chain fatty acid transport protein